MNAGKKAKTSKRKSKKSAPDSLTKSSRKGDIELSEKELGRVSGGVSAVKFKEL